MDAWTLKLKNLGLFVLYEKPMSYFSHKFKLACSLNKSSAYPNLNQMDLSESSSASVDFP